MFSKFSNNSKGIILGITGFSAFALSDVVAKWLTASYGTLQIIGMNAGAALILAALFSPFLGGFRRTLRTRKLKQHLGRGVCNIIIGVLLIAALGKLPIASIYTLEFLSPFVTTLLAILIYKERVSRSGWMVIAAGFAGVLVVLRPGFAIIDPWLFLPILSTLFIAGLFLFARGLDEDETLLSLIFFPLGFNFLATIPFIIIHDGLPQLSHLPFFVLSGALLITGQLCTAVAFRIAKTSLISPLHYTQMLWAIVFGVVMFGDIPNIWMIMGGAIIIGSGLYLVTHERKAPGYGPEHV